MADNQGEPLSLNARFSQVQQQSNNIGREARVANYTFVQKKKRFSQIRERREGLPASNNNFRRAPKREYMAPPRGKPNARGYINKRGQRGRGRGGSYRGGRNGRRKEKLTAEDLDADLDSYFGKDAKLMAAKLDDELDEYMKQIDNVEASSKENGQSTLQTDNNEPQNNAEAQ
jgi:hypothetical protein